MKTNKSECLVGIAILMLTGAAFGKTQVPNTFQSGQPALAEEVNDNFDALAEAIDQNVSDIQAIPAGPTGPHLYLRVRPL